MTRSELLAEIADIMDMEPEELRTENTLASLPWTSLTAMAYVAFCDYEFKVSLNASNIADCRTVNDLVNLVEAALE